MVNTQLLKSIIKEKGLKRNYIAEKLGVSKTTLSYKMNNVRDFYSKEIQTFCSILDIDSLEKKEEIFFAKGVDK